MGHVIGVRNRKRSLNVQSGFFNLGLAALHRNLEVQKDMLHLCAQGPLSVFDRLSVDTVAGGTLTHYNAQQVSSPVSPIQPVQTYASYSHNHAL